MSHSPEPWTVEVLPKSMVIVDTNDNLIARMPMNDDPVTEPVMTTNANRIVACVNACAGIPTEHLQWLASADQCYRDQIRMLLAVYFRNAK